MVRIAVLKDIPDFVLAIHGHYTIQNPLTGKILRDDRLLKDSRVGIRPEGIYIGRELFSATHLELYTSKEFIISTDKTEKSYRGWINIIKTKKGDLLVVNRLPLEDYVRGVLYHEISHRWPMEAMKAQAVATRSYVLYQSDISKNKQFDVTDDIYSQVYGGRSAERFRTNLAVNRTEGEILTFKGNILPAYFHANSGGYTENVEELWKHEGLTPLHGGVDAYAAGMPSYTWTRNFRLKDIQDKLNEQGQDLDLIKDMSVVERTNSGRVKKIQITTRQGKVVVITGKNFRDAIGPNILRSSKFDIVMKGYFCDINGLGWGHGVGMSQWGAYNMATRRFSYTQILNYYYPGAEIKKIGAAQ